MVPDRRILIGRTFPAVRYLIREEDIQDYLSVAGEIHPAFFSHDEARAAGYDRRVIPPSFAPFVAILGMLRSFDWGKDFFLDYRTGTAMFGEQSLEYLRPLYVGETLTIQGTVTDVTEKKGKRPFDVVQMRVAATDERGAAAFQGALSYILFK